MKMVNLFSVPMPFNLRQINQIAQINNEVSSSRIQYMYNTLTRNAVDICGFEQTRVVDDRVNCIEDMLPFIEQVHKLGMEFIFLLNSPRVMAEEEFLVNEKKLRRILEILMREGVYDVRVCSPLLVDFLAHEYPQISIRCSTSQEYFSIKQYQNLTFLYPQIVEVVPSWELNRNFRFLSSLRQTGKLTVELMVNEGCLSGCPFRTYHSMFEPSKVNCNYPRFASFFKSGCEKNFYHDTWKSICMSNIIYPWQITAYNEIGIYNFKLVGRNTSAFRNGKYMDIYHAYLLGIEDIHFIENEPISIFSNYLMNHPLLKGITVSDVRYMLPDIDFFRKGKTVCTSDCRVTCHYCETLAERLQEKFPIKNH